jgi:hypothetical protein
MDANQLEAMFFEHVPEQFCRRALRMIFDARRRAWDHCKAEFPPTEAENVRPWYVRGKVETQLRDVADLHATDGMTHRVLKAPGSGWNHTEVMAGPVLLTAGAVQTPCGPINKADFRLGLAASNQGSLFDSGPMGENLYVMLVHSGYRSMSASDQAKYGHLPASAYLAFPAADLDSYLLEVNLFDRYPDIVQASLPQEWNKEAIVRFMYDARKTSWPRSA